MRILLVIFVAFLVSAGSMLFAEIDSGTEKRDLSTLWQSQIQQIPEVELSLSTSPAAVSPGDTFSLIIELVSNQSSISNPSILVEPPSSVTADVSALPPGTSVDIQNNRLFWQPTLKGAGARSSVAFRFTANVANIEEPNQEIIVQLDNISRSRSHSTSIWIGVLPLASIELNPPQAAVGQPLQLKAAVSGPGPITTEWSLGDGRVVEASEPSILYPLSGEYEISLKASNPLGSKVVKDTVSILPQPIAHFEPLDTSVSIGQEVIFQNQSGGEPPLRYAWDFGDGSTSQEVSPVHNFSRPGSFNVRLEVVNEHGASESYGQIVVADPPIADAIIPTSGIAGRVFEAAAFTDDSVTNVSWNMGDGRRHDESEIRHVYWSSGDYNVTMTAQNDFGTTTVSQWVHIEPGNFLLYLPMSISANASGDGVRRSSAEPSEQSNQLTNDSESKLTALIFPDGATPAEQLLAYINDARIRNNMRPLRYVHELSVAAQRHTDDMAANMITGHTGSDNSMPALRIQEAGYPGGYGGEATAWGMEDPLDPVEFWLNSPGHRAILLHPAVTDVGVGFTLNYSSPNIWYWTAEFGSLSLPVIQIAPTADPASSQPPATSNQEETVAADELEAIQQLGPPQGSQFNLSPGSVLNFTWSLNRELQEGERFVVLLEGPGGEIPLGVVRQSESQLYQMSIRAEDIEVQTGAHFWLVRLQNRSGSNIATSSSWPIQLVSPGGEDARPSPTPVPATPTPEPTTAPQPDTLPTPLPIATPLPDVGP